MKLVILYDTARGRFLADACSKYCDATGIDLSKKELSRWAKLLSASTSFHFNRRLWRNDYYRNPVLIANQKTASAKIIKKYSPVADAVLQFGVMFPCDYSVFGKAKLFIYSDGVYDPENANWYSPRFGGSFMRMQKTVYNQAAGAFTFSEWARRQHLTQYGLPENKVIRCGWGPCVPVPQETPEIKRRANRFVFVGLSAWVKGLDVLVTAFKTVKRNHPGVTLDVVGLEAEDAPAAVEGINFLGKCGPDRLASILGRAEVFVLPSRFDRSPHAVVEAMAYGLPVIVTDVYGAAEPVKAGECGLVIPPDSPDALIAAMDNLIEHPELVAEMSGRARREAEAAWSWEKVSVRMLKTIARTLFSQQPVSGKPLDPAEAKSANNIDDF